VTGNIRVPEANIEEYSMSDDRFVKVMSEDAEKVFQGLCFDKKEIYKHFRLLGYEYGGLFKGINKRGTSGTKEEHDLFSLAVRRTI
jgi:hypothetical protein